MNLNPIVKVSQCVSAFVAVLLIWSAVLVAEVETTPGKPPSAASPEASRTLAITGTIKSEDGGAVKGAVVRAIDKKGEEAGKGISDASGGYAISGLPGGKYWVEVLASDLAYSATLKECPGPVKIDFVLVKGKEVEGVVLDQFGSPLRGVKVWAETYRLFPLVFEAEPALVKVAEAVSDEQGRFVFKHLDEGTYSAGAGADGYGQIHGRSVARFSVSKLGSTYRLAIVLMPAVSVKGKVTDAKGKPIENATVFHMPSMEFFELPPRRPEQEEGRTGADGRYVLTVSGVQPGEQLSLLAHHPEHGRSDGVWLMPEIGSVQENMDFILGAGRNIVSGTVVDSDGKPVTEAEVWVDSEKKKVRTDQEGRFRVENLADGLFRASAHKEGYVDAVSEVFYLGGGQERGGVSVSLPVAFSIRGKVTGPDGKALAGATVWAVPLAGYEREPYEPRFRRKISETRTAEEGSFALSGLSASIAYDVSAVAEGFAEKVMSNIRPGETPLTIPLDKESRVSGKVLDAQTKKPVPGISVYLSPSSEEGRPVRPMYELTGEQGGFIFRSLPSPSTYRVTVYGKGMRSDEGAPVSVGKGENKEDMVVYVRPLPPLKGIVREKESKKPVANAVIASPWGEVFAVSDEKGEFEVMEADSPLKVSTWRLVQEGDGEGIAAGERRAGAPERRDAEKELVIELVEGKVAKGKLADESGNPIAGAAIVPSATAEEGRDSFPGRSLGIEKIVKSDSKGEFEIAGLPVNMQEVRVTAWHPKYAPAAKTARFTADAKVASIEFMMDKGGIVAGTVFDDATKKPLPGARVIISDASPAREGEPTLRIPDRMVIADENGTFKVANLNLSGQYTVAARFGSLASKAADNVAPAREEQKREVNVYLRPALRISGVVVEKSSGKPVQGAAVSLYTRRGQRQAKSGPDGKFTISDLELAEPGELLLRVRAEGYCLPLDRRFSSYYERPIEVRFEGKESVEDVKIELLKGGLVRGKVVDPESRPIQGANVFVSCRLPNYPAQEFQELHDRRATTDAEGKFEIRGLSPEMSSFKIQAVRDGYAMSEETFAFSADALEKEVALTMQQGLAELFGVVRKADDQKPLRGMRLTLQDSDYRKRFVPKLAVTDEEGKYRFEKLPPSETYYLSSSTEGIVARLLGSRLIVTPVENLVIAKEDKSKELDLLAYEPFTVKGIVREKESGKAVKGVYIQLLRGVPWKKGMTTCPNCGARISGDITTCPNCRTDFTVRQWREIDSAGTDGEGKFVFKDREEGEYKIAVTAMPFQRERRYGFDSRFVRGSKEITLKLGEAAPEVVIDVPRGLSISGTVVSAGTNQPVQGAEVTLENSEYGVLADGQRKATTDETGKFEFTDLMPSSTYSLSAQGKGALARRVADVAVEEGKDATGIVLAVSPTVSMSGTVRNAETKEPVEGVTVTLYNADNEMWRLMRPWPKVATTDAEGRYKLTDLVPSDTYFLFARSKELVGSYPGYVELRPEKEAAGVDISVSPGLSVSGVVVDSTSGQPVSGARIGANRRIADQHWAGDPTEGVVSDAKGRFTVRNLEQGEYSLHASATDYSSSVSVNVTLEKGKEAPPVVIQVAKRLSLKGKVADEEGKPVANAAVSVSSMRVSGGQEYAYSSHTGMRTGPDGAFAATDIWERDASKFKIVAYHEDYGLAIVDLSPSEAQKDKEIAVTLKKGPFASVSGTVTDESGKGVKGATVSARPEISGLPTDDFQSKTTTDEGGKYSLTAVHGVTQSLTVSKDTFVPETRSSLTFSADTPQTIDFVLAPGHVIAGKFVFGKDMPAPRRRWVYLTIRSGDSYRGESINLERGTDFELRNLREGTYDIQAQTDAQIGRTYRQIYAFAQGVKTDTKDLVIKFGTGSVAGKVVGIPDGKPVKKFQISPLFSFGGRTMYVSGESFTTDSGEFELKFLPEGTYQLRVSAEGYVYRTVDGVKVEEERVTRDVRVELEKLLTVTGTVVSEADKKPIADVVVVLSQEGLATPLRDKTDPQGKFSLTGVRKGQYTLAFSHPMFVKDMFSHEIVDATEFDWGEIRLLPRPYVEGKVVDGKGKGVEGATIKIMGASYAGARTDSEGKYRIDGVREGQVAVECEVVAGEGTYLRQSKTDDTLGKEKLSVDFSLSVGDWQKIPPYQARPPHSDKMVEIQGGWFQMGSEDQDDEKPAHKVYVDSFFMDKYEVTNEELCQFLNDVGTETDAQGHLMVVMGPASTETNMLHLPCPLPGIEKVGDKYRVSTRTPGQERQPVSPVSWHGAAAYAQWAGKRLPTEAEWEYAAKAGLLGNTYPWGNDEPDGTQCNMNSGQSRYYEPAVSSVGSYEANGFGVYDLAGNVWEWCADWFDATYYARSPERNPTGPAAGSFRVLRGGAHDADGLTVRCANRERYCLHWVGVARGMRCVRSVNEPPIGSFLKLAGDPMKDGMVELTVSLRNWDTERGMRIRPSVSLPGGWSASQVSAEELVLAPGQSVPLSVKASGPKLQPFVPNSFEVNLKTEWGGVSGEEKVACTFGQGDWYVIGPFGKGDPRRLDVVYPPEEEIRLDATYVTPGAVSDKAAGGLDATIKTRGGEIGGTGSDRVRSLAELDATRKMEGGKLRWKRVASPVHPVCFIEHVGPYDDVVAYAYTEIMSEGDVDVTCRMGSDDGVKLFHNGREVLSREVARSFAPDQEVIPLRLRAGKNAFLVKVSNGVRHWGFSFELSGPSAGAALPGNRAVHFHGGEHHIAIRSAKSLEDTSNFTAEAWINVEDYDREGYSNLVDTFGSSYVFGLYKGKANAGFWHEKKWNFVEAPSLIPKGVWTHLALAWDGTYLRLYMQGTEVASSKYPGAVPGRAASGLKLGGNKYAGLMDEVRVWNVALSGGQIRDRMNKRLSGSVPGLRGCWSFDEGQGSAVRDVSGNNNHSQLQIMQGIGPPAPTWAEQGAPLSADEKH